jgi:hypothetical protein
MSVRIDKMFSPVWRYLFSAVGSDCAYSHDVKKERLRMAVALDGLALAEDIAGENPDDASEWSSRARQ